MKKSESKPQTEAEKMDEWRRKRAQQGELQKPKAKKAKAEK